jgi:hypothetical protein
MHLTPRPSGIIWMFLVCLLTFVAPAVAQPAPSPQGTCINQSPRKVKFDPTRTSPPSQGEDYNFVSPAPVVETSTPNPARIKYQGRELELCDRHYHIPVENIQGCTDEKADKRPNGSGPPPVGQWVEIHNVYAREASHAGECAHGHDHELKCCLKPPFVVVGSSALIADHDAPPAFVDFSEWAGSATSEDPVTGCNATPAEWHFGLSCQARLTPATLERSVGGKAHPARTLQGPNRVSGDLTLVGSNYSTAACRDVRRDSIANNDAAQKICPGVCKWPLNRFSGQWTNKEGYAVCNCCPLDRPQ